MKANLLASESERETVTKERDYINQKNHENISKVEKQKEEIEFLRHNIENLDHKMHASEFVSQKFVLISKKNPQKFSTEKHL